MWDYGMMGYGGWMLVWGLGGLLIFGTVIYTAVRMGVHYVRRDERGYHDCSGIRSERYHADHDGRYRNDDGCYHGDDR